MKTYMATLTFALALTALPAAASAQSASAGSQNQVIRGKTVDNCPHKASASRNENRAQMREIASRLSHPRQNQRSSGSRAVR